MKKTIASYVPELIALRHDLHQHPELGFEEIWTAKTVAGVLERYGLEVHTGWAKTGVLGILRKGSSTRTIALRADMDALPVQERSDLEYRSVNKGIMHACGHDGHMVMLLGAARYLAERGDFDGTVVFIFQPAEEGGGGGRLMVKEGIVETFGIQAVYGMHNRSGLEAGWISTHTGPIMAATDNFEIIVNGEGTHAALPHTGVDPIVTASELVTSLQTAVTRKIEALDSVVLSITQFTSGTTFNIIPDDALLRGCTRYQSTETGVLLREAMERITAGVCAAHHAHYFFNYMPGYPPTVNTLTETEAAVRAARKAVGAENVDDNCSPLMASEDFSYFLEKIPGCYIFLGNGTHTQSHRSDYDFNDEIIPVGVRYWCILVEQELGGIPGHGNSETR
ncbi:MAG: M20 aminoacylase family protein [bacterium]|nr:M20 family metallopeptidase [bacterium]MDT8367350.1 M20 aminoacylase family protein [bacterium]